MLGDTFNSPYVGGFLLAACALQRKILKFLTFSIVLTVLKKLFELSIFKVIKFVFRTKSTHSLHRHQSTRYSLI